MVDLGNINRPVASQFDWTGLLGLLQQRELNDLRRQEAQIDIAQKQFNLEMDQQTRDARIESQILLNSQRKAAILESEAQAKYYNEASAWLSAYQQSVGGEDATTASVAGFVANIDSTAQAATNATFPRSQRAKNLPGAKNFFHQAVGGTVDFLLGLKDGRQAEMSRAIMGQGPYAETMRPYAAEFQEKAFQNLSREMGGIRSSIQAIPGAKYLMKAAAGSADAMLEAFDINIKELETRAVGLADPVYSHPELEGERNDAFRQAEERFIELNDARRKVASGKRVLDTGAGVITGDEMEGVRSIISARVNDLFYSQNPVAAMSALSEDLERANYIPSAEVAPLFQVAANSSDQMAQLKASMVYEDLKRRFGPSSHQVAGLQKELERLGIFDMMETMGSVRRGLGAFESGLMGTPGLMAQEAEGLMVYAAQVSDATQRAIDAVSATAEAEKTRRAVAPKQGEGALPDSDLLIAKRASAELMGEDAVGGFGLLDEMDLSLDEAMAVDGGAMYDEWWNAKITARSSTEGGKAALASASIRENYFPGTIDGKPDWTRNHPIHNARAQGRIDIDPDFALKFSRVQLQIDLDGVKDKDGNPARLQIGDIEAIHRLDVNGNSMWDIHRKGEQNVLLHFRPDFSTEAMIAVLEDDRVWTMQQTGNVPVEWIEERGAFGVFPRNRDIRDGIHRYLGVHSPRYQSERRRAVEGESQRRGFLRDRRHQDALFLERAHAPDTLLPDEVRQDLN